ncbi:hypothetical protein B0H11DRAFT_1910514 [Mycena galericulata]|nr:hypothetical protein B0H11DRAFT_1910514 [Mycena galericulata]
MFICTGCTKGQHLPLLTQLSTLVVESGSVGRKREWEAWLQLHHHFGFWTPSPDPSVPSHSPPGSPPSWSKAGVWVERESRKHGFHCTWTPSLNPSIPSHSPPSSPPSWSKAGVWVERESEAWLPLHRNFGFACQHLLVHGPHRSTLASLPTLHPRGRKRESGSKERVGSMAPTAPSFRILNIVSIPLEAQCVPRWVDMAGKLPAPLNECCVHPVRGPTWWGNFPLHSVNVVSIPLEAQCVPRRVDMAGKLPAPLSECHVHPIRGPTWRGHLSLYPVSVVSIPLEAQCATQWIDMAGTILAVPSECRVHPVRVPVCALMGIWTTDSGSLTQPAVTATCSYFCDRWQIEVHRVARGPKSGQQAFRCSPPGSPLSRLKAGAWVESERPSWKSGQQAFESESENLAYAAPFFLFLLPAPLPLFIHKATWQPLTKHWQSVVFSCPASALAVVSPWHESFYILCIAWPQPGKLRPLFGFWGIKVATWQVATSVWALGDKSRNLSQPGKLRLLFGFWGIKVVTWALGDQGRNLASCDLCLGSGG